MWAVSTMGVLAPIPKTPKKLNGGNTLRFHNDLFKLSVNINNWFIIVKKIF